MTPSFTILSFTIPTMDGCNCLSLLTYTFNRRMIIIEKPYNIESVNNSSGICLSLLAYTWFLAPTDMIRV
jgi:hypothetical protein